VFSLITSKLEARSSPSNCQVNKTATTSGRFFNDYDSLLK
jgi:hypothetical protein